MSGMLNRLKIILKGDAKSESPIQMDVAPIPIQKEQSFFAQKNNLMDYEEDAPAIESSNLSAHERYVFPIEVEYKGYMLQAEDADQLNIYMERVDKGDTKGLWTLAEFTRKYLPVLNEEVEKYENDIENMPGFYKQLPKTDYGKSTIAKMSLKAPAKQVKVFSEESGTQMGDAQEIQLGEVNMAYINRAENDTRNFAQFRDDWEANQKENKIVKAMNLLKDEEDALQLD